MISILSFNRDAAEQGMIEQSCRREIARRSDEPLQYTRAMGYEDLRQFDAADNLADLIYYEIENEADVERLKVLRQKTPLALLALFTSPQISPMLYLRPRIAPSMLLLQPLSQEALDGLNSELLDTFFEQMEAAAPSRCFVLKERDGKTLLPYEKISYFESRNKKIHLRAGSEEYEFYDSIENIEGQLPEYFMRCHRSFLVNTRKIQKIRMAENCLELYSGATVPLSRTYRQKIRELMR
mgnify:CR=1 FL=1